MTDISGEFLDLQAALAGEYSLEREVGRGGMGVVYLARDVQLDRHVAIKVLPAHLAEQPDDRARFLREARTAAGLSHPHIVPIHRVGEARGFVFFVMSYVAGETLGERLRRTGPLPAAEAMRVMREVAWALAHAHSHGVVHRDVKPDNILLEAGTGRAVVTDFGIAHRDDAVSSTDPGRIMGTAHFMSPEQGASGPLDGRSDLYSLGVVGYLAASGRLPFEASSLPALLLRQATVEAPSVATVAPGLPAALARAIERCLRADPARRFATGAELAAALEPSPDRQHSLPAPLRAWLSARNPAQGFYAAFSGLLGLALTADAVSAMRHGSFVRFENMAIIVAVMSLPLVPIIGYHCKQAMRLFRAGFSLADLRTALDVERQERLDAEAVAAPEAMGLPLKALRLGTYASIASAFYFAFFSSPLSPAGFRLRMIVQATSVISMLVFLAASNINDVPLLPDFVRRPTRLGVRERMWRSALGAWVARRLGAPATSRPVGEGVFRPTEAALGVAAAELFAALPGAQREQLAELPATVAALEARAAEARAEVDALAALAPAGSSDADVLSGRRDAATGRLGSTVAALEGIRLDLLRLHAGANDLAPLTTLIDAARLLGEDVSRLADAQREAEALAVPKRLGARRVPTPA